MSKFNSSTIERPIGAHTRKSSAAFVVKMEPDQVTFEGAPAYSCDPKTELFLLAVTNFVGEKTFYESAEDRDSRFSKLVREVALLDLTWLTNFGLWLRSEGNMRSASLVLAAEAVRSGAIGTRRLVAAVLQRADEPGELIAYWHTHYGKSLPKGLKRGIADSLSRLYTERSVLKYDTPSHAVRFADVIRLTHPRPSPKNAALFAHLVNPAQVLTYHSNLPILMSNQRLRALDPEVILDAAENGQLAGALNKAGMTWEAIPSLTKGPWTAKLWESIIPSMGYMALLRNLRNFDEAGISNEAAIAVATKLADPEEVAKSRQFPFRFLSAYEQAPNLRWGQVLDAALTHAVANVPSLPGRSLILVDTSGSMTGFGYSAKSTVTPLKAAAVFGVSLASKGEQVELVGFADGTFEHKIPKGASVIREVQRFYDRAGEVGHGTQIAASLRRHYSGHDRVFIISDMQTSDTNVSSQVPSNVPVYVFNLGGYAATPIPGHKHRHELGSLTDATFKLIPLLERGIKTWPWE